MRVFYLSSDMALDKTQAAISEMWAWHGTKAYKVSGVNLNSVADTAITGLPAKWRPTKLTAYDTSGTPVLAAVALYTGAGATGTNLVSAMVLTGLTGASKVADATLIAITDYRTETTIYLRNVTAQGTALTASFVLFLEDLT